MTQLYELFSNESIKNFGKALRNALRDKDAKTQEGKPIPGAQDYASFIELEWAESKEEFIDMLSKFLHRYNSYIRSVKQKKDTDYIPFLPDEKDLEEIIKLVDSYGVKPVKVAILSYALVKSERGE